MQATSVTHRLSRLQGRAGGNSSAPTLLTRSQTGVTFRPSLETLKAGDQRAPPFSGSLDFIDANVFPRGWPRPKRKRSWLVVGLIWQIWVMVREIIIYSVLAHGPFSPTGWHSRLHMPPHPATPLPTLRSHAITPTSRLVPDMLGDFRRLASAGSRVVDLATLLLIAPHSGGFPVQAILAVSWYRDVRFCNIKK